MGTVRSRRPFTRSSQRRPSTSVSSVYVLRWHRVRPLSLLKAGAQDGIPALVGVLQEVHQEVNQHDDDDEPHQEPYYVLHVSSSTTWMSFTLDPGCLII